MPRSQLVALTSVVGRALAAVRALSVHGDSGSLPTRVWPPLEARRALGFSCIC